MGATLHLLCCRILLSTGAFRTLLCRVLPVDTTEAGISETWCDIKGEAYNGADCEPLSHVRVYESRLCSLRSWRGTTRPQLGLCFPTVVASGVGGWCNGIIHINLLSKVSSATQDRPSVVPESGHVTTMNDSPPLLDGISHKRRIHSIVGVPGRLILAISGTRPRSTHRGSYQGSEYRNYLTPENLVLSVSSEGRHKLNMSGER